MPPGGPNPYAPPSPQAPYGYGGPMQPGGPALQPGAIKERSSAVVVVLTLVTCGLYAHYWVFKTTDELKQATNDTQLSPGLDLVLSILTCALWSFAVMYRNAQKVHACLLPYAPNRKDQAQATLLLNILSLIVGVTWLIALYISQEELNQVARIGRGA